MSDHCQFHKCLLPEVHRWNQLQSDRRDIQMEHDAVLWRTAASCTAAMLVPALAKYRDMEIAERARCRHELLRRRRAEARARQKALYRARTAIEAALKVAEGG